MNNIKSFFEWIEIKKDKDGNKFIDNQSIDDPYNNLDRVIKRLQNKTIDKVCGGVRNLENNFGDNKIIHLLYNNDSKKLASIIDENDENTVYGYVNFEKDLGLKNTSDIKSIFKQISNGVGKGEVLLSCLFQDVRMKNRESDNPEEKGDCAIIGKDGILYHIEVKSADAEFKFINDYIYSIAYYISNKNRKNETKPTILVYFDNKPGDDDVNGFFWIMCGILKSTNKNETINRLKNILLQIVDTNNFTEINKKPKKGYFSAYFDKEIQKIKISPRD